MRRAYCAVTAITVRDRRHAVPRRRLRPAGSRRRRRYGHSSRPAKRPTAARRGVAASIRREPALEQAGAAEARPRARAVAPASAVRPEQGHASRDARTRSLCSSFGRKRSSSEEPMMVPSVRVSGKTWRCSRRYSGVSFFTPTRESSASEAAAARKSLLDAGDKKRHVPEQSLSIAEIERCGGRAQRHVDSGRELPSRAWRNATMAARPLVVRHVRGWVDSLLEPDPLRPERASRCENPSRNTLDGARVEPEQ